ncbi:MAG: hypothetical protein ACK56Q_14745 [Pirellulaceae bacterium]
MRRLALDVLSMSPRCGTLWECAGAMRLFCLLCWVFLIGGRLSIFANELRLEGVAEGVRVVEVRKVWDEAPHNAFTDLAHHDGTWALVFREGSQHVSPDGALRVLTSQDGRQWRPAARITMPEADLRDAKISRTPDGRWMLTGAAAWHPPSQSSHQSFVWFSDDLQQWSQAYPVGDPDVWLWRITWHQGVAYGIGYGCGSDRFVRLYRSEDGIHFTTLVDRLLEGSYPNESSIQFDGQTAYCLLRRDETPFGAMVGKSLPPYTKWQWKDTEVRIGGPHWTKSPDGRWVAAVRLLDGQARTSLCLADPEVGSLREVCRLPSGGDTSYAGLVWQANRLWVSYYASHEGKSAIYLAEVEVDPEVLDVGSRRELLIDRVFEDRIQGCQLMMHPPSRIDELPGLAGSMEYGTVVRDGAVWHLFSRDGRGAKFDGDVTEVTRYWRSEDGLHWTAPKLGLVELDGSKENNVILQEAPFCHNFSPFLDERPGVPDEERWKALGGTVKTGLFAFASADGIHWKKWKDFPVIQYSKEYAFDSQNVAFWSESERQYVCYFRHFLDKKLRSVCRTTSKDFEQWSEPVPMRPNLPEEHLYTSMTHPYFRAPHIYLATPTRFFGDRGDSTDILLMTARGSQSFDRTFRDAFLRPGLDPARWGNRSNYAAWHVVPVDEQTMALYLTPFRRALWRVDGMTSLHAGADEGMYRTRLFRYQGSRLELNAETSAGGEILVELQDDQGQPLPVCSFADSQPIVGSKIAWQVEWKGGVRLEQWAGKPVRMAVRLREADLYSWKFSPAEE